MVVVLALHRRGVDLAARDVVERLQVLEVVLVATEDRVHEVLGVVLVDVELLLLVEQVEHVDEEVHLGVLVQPAPILQLDIELRGGGRARRGATREQVGLARAVARVDASAEDVVRDAGLRAEASTRGDEARLLEIELVEAVELEVVRAVETERAIAVRHQVGEIVERRDVRVVLARLRGEQTGVVTLALRVRVRRDEERHPGRLLRHRQLERVVVAHRLLEGLHRVHLGRAAQVERAERNLLRIARSHQRGCLRLELVGLAIEVLARVRDQVVVATVDRDVLDDDRQRAVLEGRADLEVRHELVLRAEDELVRALALHTGRHELDAAAEDRLLEAVVAHLELRHDVGTRLAGHVVDVAVRVVLASGRGEPVLVDGGEVRDLAAERADVEVHRHVLVEPAVVAEDLRLAFLGRVVDEADARREQVVQLVGLVGNDLALGRRGSDQLVSRIADLLLPAQAQVQREVRADLPLVLEVRADVAVRGVGGQDIRTAADRLVVRAQRLAHREGDRFRVHRFGRRQDANELVELACLPATRRARRGVRRAAIADATRVVFVLRIPGVLEVNTSLEHVEPRRSQLLAVRDRERHRLAVIHLVLEQVDALLGVRGDRAVPDLLVPVVRVGVVALRDLRTLEVGKVVERTLVVVEDRGDLLRRAERALVGKTTVVTEHRVDLRGAAVELRRPLAGDVVRTVIVLPARLRRVTGDAEHVLHVARVAERGDLKLVVLVDGAVDLAGEEVGLGVARDLARRDLLVDREPGGWIDICDAVRRLAVLSIDLGPHQSLHRGVRDRRVEADVEPQLVLDDRTTELRADVVAVVEVALAVDRAAFALDGLRRGDQRRGRRIAEHRAAELVRARLGHDVDDAAGRAAVLGVVAAGDDLGLVDELVREVRRDATEAGVRRVDTLDDVRVLTGGRAGKRDAVRVRLCTGRLTDHAAERTRRGDVAGVVVADRQTGLGRALIDDRRGALDLDDLALGLAGSGRRVDRHVDDGFLADLDQHVAAGERGVVVVDRQDVDARRQRRDEVLTTLFGDHDLLALKRRGRRDNRRADRRFAGCLVADRSAEATNARAALGLRLGLRD